MDKEKINLITKDLFTTKEENDVIRLEGKDIVYKGNVLTDAEKKSIISQAETIKKLELWNILQSEMRYLASEKLYYDCKTEEDILFAKAVLWGIDVLDKKITNLSKMK